MDDLLTRLNFTHAPSLSSGLSNSLGLNFARAPSFSPGPDSLLGFNFADALGFSTSSIRDFLGSGFPDTSSLFAGLNKFVARLNFSFPASLNELIARFNLTHAASFFTRLSKLAHQSPVDFVEWLNQPHVRTPVLVWVITFTIVMAFIMWLGFGRAGIVAGSLAAAFQSWAYGAFTPAGGLFASLTSLGMLGYCMPAGAAVAAVVSTSVTLIVSGSFGG
ncbi:MAG: hypothetical protein M1813_001267 [Trichoglossum hirsutum]|nr:MAG: hypothetical protein M1813_001267 [Trichoglossum hirsutum]